MKPALPREAEKPHCQGNGLVCTLRKLGPSWRGWDGMRAQSWLRVQSWSVVQGTEMRKRREGTAEVFTSGTFLSPHFLMGKNLSCGFLQG